MLEQGLLYWRVEAELVCLLLTVWLAWRWGAGPERWCAAAILFMAVADRPYHWIFGRKGIFYAVDIGHVAIDLVAAAILLAIALRANRLYPLCLAALQIVSLTSHIARDLSVRIAERAYGVLIVGPSYFEIAVLATGIVLHHRRVLRHGWYRSWRTSSNRSPAPGPIEPPAI